MKEKKLKSFSFFGIYIYIYNIRNKNRIRRKVMLSINANAKLNTKAIAANTYNEHLVIEAGFVYANFDPYNTANKILDTGEFYRT